MSTYNKDIIIIARYQVKIILHKLCKFKYLWREGHKCLYLTRYKCTIIGCLVRLKFSQAKDIFKEVKDIRLHF